MSHPHQGSPWLVLSPLGALLGRPSVKGAQNKSQFPILLSQNQKGNSIVRGLYLAVRTRKFFKTLVKTTSVFTFSSNNLKYRNRLPTMTQGVYVTKTDTGSQSQAFYSAILNIALFFLNFYCYSITVVCLFSQSLHPTPAKPTSLPHLHLPP